MTGPCPDTGKATSSSDWTAPRSAPSWNAPPATRCCCTYPGWMATASSHACTTAPHWPVTAPQPSATRSPRRSPPCPKQLRRTLTWDRGKELAQHAQLRIDTGVQVFFADPHSPWQRGTNENTNGLLRQYFPKGTDLARWNHNHLNAVADTLNSRPRKTLGWNTPAEVLNKLLLSPPTNSV